MSELTRNPDILTCLANLSNDEVFTPPEVANAMLDLIPEDFWKDPNVKILDPACKSGVFLREAAKRFLKGEEEAIPDLKERVDHIFHKQLFGYAITELTSQLSRRTVYCSKTANGKYSVTSFKSEKGNIAFSRVEHTWVDGKCSHCGASQEVYNRGDEAETHAYQFIHLTSQQIKDLDMKFDLIIGNPPYQLSDGGNNASAIPLYHKFVEMAKTLKPRFIDMIIPARWYAGGRGLDDFRIEMIKDKRISKLYDFANSSDCFPGVNIAGGVCYFLWDRDKKDKECLVSNLNNDGLISESKRRLDEFPMFIRSNQAMSIIRKIGVSKSISSIVLPSNPFGFRTYEKGEQDRFPNAVELVTSEKIGYVPRDRITKNSQSIDSYNVILTRAMSGGNKPMSDGKYQIIPSTIRIMTPGQICVETFICIGNFDTEEEANNLITYLKTKFARFLMLQVLSSIMINKDVFMFVPMQDFSKPWTDEELYEKYDLTEDEIKFIESMIKPME
jgi:site-specific DNA-methyltransferase (adenine-specific)